MSRYLSLLLLCLWAPLSALAQSSDDLLAPEKAFKLEASVKDGKTLIAEYDIADGYYLYRSKFQFSTETDGVSLGEPQVPEGKVKHDEFFGDVQIHRDRIRIQIPIERDEPSARGLELKARSQGCADMGVCYPPQVQTASLELPAATGPVAQETQQQTEEQPQQSPSATEQLGQLTDELTGGGSDELLDPDKAFQFSAEAKDQDTVVARWDIAEGYYLYRDKIQLSLKDAPGYSVAEIQRPEGKVKEDEFFGRMQVYYQDVTVPVELQRQEGAGNTINLVAKYQGCAEAQGVCYPPITKTASLKLPDMAAGAAAAEQPSEGEPAAGQQEAAAPPAEGAAQPSPGAPAAAPTQPEQQRLAEGLATGSIWFNVGLFFVLGLLLAFTPCVFPMIPILSGIIVGQGEQITTGRAFGLSLAYVLAMAITYTLLGVVVGLSGESVQAFFQNPWILSAFAVIFVLLALSMFGFYDLQMPASMQSKLSEVSNRQQSGTLIGAGVMGFLSALIVGPCVTAPLVGALIYIADTGDAVLGGAALFSLSIGMGAPLLVIGTAGGKLLPKAGPWMDAIKAVFGVLLLAIGIWMLERFLPRPIILALSAILLIVSAIYMGAFERIKEGASGWYRLWKGLGLVLALYGAMLLVGAAAGSKSLLQPLEGLAVAGGSGTTHAEEGLAFNQVKGVQGVEQAIAAAARQDRPVMLDFYADWCVSCKEMEKYTFSDPRVQQALDDVVLLQTDVTDNDSRDRALLKQYGLFGPPAILFFNRDGEEIEGARVVGFKGAEAFAEHVRQTLDVSGGASGESS